jgi:hypothetical protein
MSFLESNTLIVHISGIHCDIPMHTTLITHIQASSTLIFLHSTPPFTVLPGKQNLFCSLGTG